jgi:hypothetical protein
MTDRLTLEAIDANRLWYAAWLRSDADECAKQVVRCHRILWERRLKDITHLRDIRISRKGD